MKISITRALKELSLIGEKIEKKISEFACVDVKRKRTGEIVLDNRMTVQEFNDSVKSKYQSIKDLILLRQKIKKSIIESNAKTIVKIGDVVMTVAEAIDKKASIKYTQALEKRMNKLFQEKLHDISTTEASLNNQVSVMLEKNLGGDRKASKDDYDNIAKPFIEANTITLVDPINAKKEIEELQDGINKFLSDVDIVLSESNSKTEIEI